MSFGKDKLGLIFGEQLDDALTPVFIKGGDEGQLAGFCGVGSIVEG